MVRTLTWVLAGLVAYSIVAALLRARGLLPESIRVSGPITTLHTKRGRDLLDWLARPKRYWRAWANLGVGVALVVMAGSFLLVVSGAYFATQNPEPTQLNEPRNVLAIPGVNDFLPLSVAPAIVAGLLFGLVVHEGGHGLLCRVEDIDIDSMGLAFLTVVPVGAFVEPDEENLAEADRGSQLRMFAAGVTNNFALSILAFALLFGPVIGSFAVVSGAPVGGVLPGSAADRAGISPGDVVTGVGDVEVDSAEELDAALAATNRSTITVHRKDAASVEVDRSVVVTDAVAGAPVEINTTITAVNGTAVGTAADLERVAGDHPFATLATDGGEIRTALGAYVRVAEEGPFADAGAPAGERMIVTSLGGERTVTAADLLAALGNTSTGDEVTVVGYVDGDRRSYEVTLGENEDSDAGLLGISSARSGISGFAVDDFGIDEYPAGAFLHILGGGGDSGLGPFSFAERIWLVLLLPFASTVGGVFQYNFAGFTGIATNFYEVEGLLGVLGITPAFVLANVLFWTGWINLIIGQFNCIPSFPLDGGHILRASTESVVSRIPVEDRRSVTTAVTGMVTLAMIGGLVVMIFGPQWLA